jgi:2-keto-4-pentenoate hydratase
MPSGWRSSNWSCDPAGLRDGSQRAAAWLIEYLSSFMTLAPGDVILTGTPEGVVDVRPGDEVVTEIDGIGALVNTIVGDAAFGR